MGIESQIREVLKRNGITDSKVLMQELLDVVTEYGDDSYCLGSAAGYNEGYDAGREYE